MAHQWTAEEDALLGTLSDPEVASRLGIARATVERRRRKLCRPAYAGSNGQKQLPDDETLMAELAILSQSEVARKYGVSRQAVAIKVKRMGEQPP